MSTELKRTIKSSKRRRKGRKLRKELEESKGDRIRGNNKKHILRKTPRIRGKNSKNKKHILTKHPE